VQFSFSDDNTILSESIDGLLNVIADSVGFVFLPTVILKILLSKDNSYLG
jgi:DNA-directed RNA polymerase-5 subunit 1